MARSVVAGAVCLPGAPFVLPAASPAQPTEHIDAVAALRVAAREALDSLGPLDAVVLLAAEQEPGLHSQLDLSLRPLGIPDDGVTLPVATDLIPDLTRATELRPVSRAPVGLELRVLARQVRRTHGVIPVVPVALPGAGPASRLATIGRALVGSILGLAGAVAGRRIGIVGATDLAATLDERSPGSIVDGAGAWSDAAIRTARGGDEAALAELGPAEAARVLAVGWPALVATAAVADEAGLTSRTLARHDAAGVAYAVGAFAGA